MGVEKYGGAGSERGAEGRGAELRAVESAAQNLLKVNSY